MKVYDDIISCIYNVHDLQQFIRLASLIVILTTVIHVGIYWLNFRYASGFMILAMLFGPAITQMTQFSKPYKFSARI